MNWIIEKVKGLCRRAARVLTGKSRAAKPREAREALERKLASRLPAWRLRQYQEAMKHGTSRHRNQRGQRGAFGQSAANRAAIPIPTTRKEQNRLGWNLPELPDENK